MKEENNTFSVLLQKLRRFEQRRGKKKREEVRREIQGRE